MNPVLKAVEAYRQWQRENADKPSLQVAVTRRADKFPDTKIRNRPGRQRALRRRRARNHVARASRKVNR